MTRFTQLEARVAALERRLNEMVFVPPAKEGRLGELMALVEDCAGLQRGELLVKRKFARIAWPRQVCMAAAADLLGFKAAEMAANFECNVGTVYHAQRLIAARRANGDLWSKALTEKVWTAAKKKFKINLAPESARSENEKR